MRTLLAILLLLGIGAGMALSRTRFVRCDPYAEKCPACKDCSACVACTKERNRCSVCRDKR